MKIIHHNEKPAVCALAITADGRHAFAAGNGGDIWIIDTERGTAAKMINNTYSINALVLSADEQTLVASDTRGCLMAFDLLTRARIWVSDNDDSPVLCLAIDPVAKHVFSGDDGGDIIQWDIASGKKLNTNFSLEAGVLSLSFTPDGSKIVVGTDKKDIDVYSRSGDHIGSFDQRTPTNAVAVAPDGKRFVATFDEKDIVFAEIHNDEVKIIRVLSGHTSFVNSLAVTPDGASVISASTDGSVRLWKLQESAGEKV
jgi:WD40 repeat protein